MGNKEIKYIVLPDGKKVYSELYSGGHKDTVLLIHGGPGDSCVSFSYFAVLLAEFCNVVLLDQRGVMRSETENRQEYLTIDRLIDDFEDIRNILGIKKWFILGHSFGGYIALRYAVKYTASLNGVIYENPFFDIYHSVSSIIKGYEQLYIAEKAYEKLEKLQRIAELDDVLNQFESLFMFPERDRKHVFGSEAVTEKCREYYDDSLIDEEAKTRCVRHYEMIKKDATLISDYFSAVKKVDIPCFLIKGEKDPLLPEEDIAEWSSYPERILIRVKEAGHYVHSDLPEL